MSEPNPSGSAPQFACVYQPPGISAVPAGSAADVMIELAEAFSPRYERHGEQAVTFDIRGLDRLLGSPHAIGEELRRDAADRGLRAHIAIAPSRTTAMVLAYASPGLRVVDAGDEAAALAPIPIGILEKIHCHEEGTQSTQSAQKSFPLKTSANSAFPLGDLLGVLRQWGIRTLGEFAALPSSELAARLGRAGVKWQSLARGEDQRPLVPVRPEERFEASLELEWPIEGLEPLSFVLTRLFEPLTTRLEARDRSAAALHIALGLVTRDVHERRLELPSPLRDVRTLRTLALLDLESHPPAAAIDRVTITVDPTPGRILQHTLFTRPHPTPEQLSTLLARLGALMGQDRIGAPATMDSYRPGAFAMKPFAIEHEHQPLSTPRPPSLSHRKDLLTAAPAAANVTAALRRCRHPVPARVAVDAARRPVRVTTDRRGFAGGGVTACAGPWRTSGEWWNTDRGLTPQSQAVSDPAGQFTGGAGRAGGVAKPCLAEARAQNPAIVGGGWDRDEWDVSLSDGAIYRLFRDRSTDAWFIEAIVD
jgi:protein ImuB